MSSFLDGHWGHLATKPCQAAALWILAVLIFHFDPWLATGLSLALPALYSGIRKQVRWPGSMTSAIGWKDLAADTWAGAVAVVPLSAALPWPLTLGLLALMLVVLWPLGLHRWALP